MSRKHKLRNMNNVKISNVLRFRDLIYIRDGKTQEEKWVPIKVLFDTLLYDLKHSPEIVDSSPPLTSTAPEGVAGPLQSELSLE